MAMSRRRRVLVWTLIVAASVIAIAWVLTTWVHRQMLDEQSWKNASARLIEDPQVRGALSVYLVNELYDNVTSLRRSASACRPASNRSQRRSRARCASPRPAP
jgi:hypothetical protein